MDNLCFSGVNFESGAATCTPLSQPFSAPRHQTHGSYYQDIRVQNGFAGEEEDMAQNARLYGSICELGELEFTNSVDSLDDVTPSPRSNISSSEMEQGYEMNPFPDLSVVPKPAEPLQASKVTVIPPRPQAFYQSVFAAKPKVTSPKIPSSANPSGGLPANSLSNSGNGGFGSAVVASMTSQEPKREHKREALGTSQQLQAGAIAPQCKNINSIPKTAKKRSRNDADETGEGQTEPPKKRARGSPRDPSQPPKSSQITLAHVTPYFELPIREAAQRLGLCTTLLKQLCRRLGVKRWPQRKLSALDRKIHGLEGKLRRVTNEAERLKIESEISKTRHEKSVVIANAATPISADSNPDSNSGSDAMEFENESDPDEQPYIVNNVDFGLNGTSFMSTFFGFDDGNNDGPVSVFFDTV